MLTAMAPTKLASRIAFVVLAILVTIGLAALVSWSFAGYLTSSVLISLLSGFSFCE
ncbi:hypothetical protein BSIN_3815 [Burkholderia singularis]|uniref:Uncharacterized protein n=1 Tax=Burkholderia singularis TaxID=1503053 RepID=A0A238H652_9BURK|nr:hypothetical protein BSIN_3815 [Burkholderia singularis]